MSESTKLKNPYSNDLIEHFAPLHETLTIMANSADELESEGGMTWTYEYLHGRGHTAKLGDDYLYTRQDFNNPSDIKIHTHSFAELIWLTLGNPNYNYFEMDHGHKPQEEYEAERNKVISTYYSKAVEIVSLFQTSPCEKCFVLFTKNDGLWIDFQAVTLKGRNAIIHSAFWSVD